MSPETRIKLLSILRISLPLLIISPQVGFAATTARHRQIKELGRSDANPFPNSTTINTSTTNTSTTKDFQPNLSNDRLMEIKLYDRMKCFPRLLCTLTKADAFKKLDDPVNLNELADGYIKLLTAFPGGPPTDLFTRSDGLLSSKDDFLGNDAGEEVGLTPFSSGDEDPDEATENNDSSASDSSEEKKKRQKHKTRNESNKDESAEMLLTDPLLHQKEKLEMKKLMEELIEEEKTVGVGGLDKSAPLWSDVAASIPMKLGTTLLKSVVLPYLLGGDGTKRRKRDLFAQQKLNSKRTPKNRNQETAIQKAMNLWTGLKSVKQCSTLYPSCPFEAWQVVSMISLITPQE